MSDNTTKITYGDYFNVSNCPCLKNYVPSREVAEVPCIWYPYSPCGPQDKPEEEPVDENPFSFISNEIFKPEELSSDKCACLTKEEKARLEHKGPLYDCIITVRVDSESIGNEEHIANLKKVVEKFRQTHEICLVIPEDMITDWYNDTYCYDFSRMNVREDYEENPYLDSRFYNALYNYEYVLRVDLNCEITGDSEDLMLFMERKQQYIAAPFTREETKRKTGVDGIMCGYGELSLRHVKTASDICNILKNIDVTETGVEDDENSIFSFGIFAFRKCCPMNLSRMFALKDNEHIGFWTEKNSGGTPFGYIR